MNYLCFSRIPQAAIKNSFDGHQYARIPHVYVDGRIVEDHASPRLVRVDDPRCFVKGGEAYVWFVTVGEALRSRLVPPYGVSIFREDDDCLPRTKACKNPSSFEVCKTSQS